MAKQLSKEIIRSNNACVCDPYWPSPLLNLPTEVLLLVLEYLCYPDALACKHVHPRLREIIAPRLTVGTRVQWLIERADQGLSVPRWNKLNLRHDHGFTSNSEVRHMLQSRRQHEDCRFLAIRHFHDQPFMEDALDWIASRNWNMLDLRCSINPNKRRCRGLQQACDMAMYMWGPADFPVEHTSNVYRRRKWIKLGSLKTIITLMWRFSYGIACAVICFNRVRRRMMFRIWTLVETLVIVAGLAHFMFGIEYITMDEYVQRVARDLDLTRDFGDTQSVSTAIWAFVDRFTGWQAVS